MAVQLMTKHQFVAAPAAVCDFRNIPVVTLFDSVYDIGARQINKRGLDTVLISGLIQLSVGKKPATRRHEGGNPSAKEPLIFGVEATRKVMDGTSLKASKDALLDFSD